MDSSYVFRDNRGDIQSICTPKHVFYNTVII